MGQDTARRAQDAFQVVQSPKDTFYIFGVIGRINTLLKWFFHRIYADFMYSTFRLSEITFFIEFLHCNWCSINLSKKTARKYLKYGMLKNLLTLSFLRELS